MNVRKRGKERKTGKGNGMRETDFEGTMGEDRKGEEREPTGKHSASVLPFYRKEHAAQSS